MRYPDRFTDPSTISERIDSGLMPVEDAKLALKDLEILYENGRVSSSEYGYLKMKLEDIIYG